MAITETVLKETKAIQYLPVSSIEPNQFNPNVMSEDKFQVLLNDMKVKGPRHEVSVDPIIVSPKNVFYNDPDASPDRYVIVDGENRWKGALADWLTVAETLPKTVTKQIGAKEGSGELKICVIAPDDAQVGEYSIPLSMDAETVGSKLTGNGWVTITVMKPTPPAPSTDIMLGMSVMFSIILAAIVGYGYLRRH
ncbi:MAG: ParB N-terminal domain-containing protein [Candidatus Bathyarchaeota archaeon]|nr:ParB N-terminal domain-containing protein [Candidatus Bathyarchaeota archaeon]